MRTPLPSLSALLLATSTIAQINAGDVPVGTSTTDPGINLILNTAFTSDSAAFDVDCDSVPDIMAYLIEGMPAVDAPNSAGLRLLNPAIELCTDLVLQQFQRRPQYYILGTPLNCAGNFNWQNTNVNVLGDYGSFGAIGPFTKNNTYVAYRLSGAQIGWLRLSFDVASSVQVSLQIHEVLQLCSATGVDELSSPAGLSLSPNPSSGELIRVESADALQRLEVLDATGRVIAQYAGNVQTLAAPQAAGTYLVRAVLADGGHTTARLVRY